MAAGLPVLMPGLCLLSAGTEIAYPGFSFQPSISCISSPEAKGCSAPLEGAGFEPRGSLSPGKGVKQPVSSQAGGKGSWQTLSGLEKTPAVSVAVSQQRQGRGWRLSTQDAMARKAGASILPSSVGQQHCHQCSERVNLGFWGSPTAMLPC